MIWAGKWVINVLACQSVSKTNNLTPTIKRKQLKITAAVYDSYYTGIHTPVFCLFCLPPQNYTQFVYIGCQTNTTK